MEGVKGCAGGNVYFAPNAVGPAAHMGICQIGAQIASQVVASKANKVHVCIGLCCCHQQIDRNQASYLACRCARSLSIYVLYFLLSTGAPSGKTNKQTKKPG